MVPNAAPESNYRAYLTMQEFADALGISKSLVKRLKQSGQIPAVQLGRVVRIPAEALNLGWLEAWRQEHVR